MKRVIFSSIFIALFSFGFFFSSNLVSAEITHPYTIDEKPQVLFGDSIIISTSTPDQTASIKDLKIINRIMLAVTHISLLLILTIGAVSLAILHEFI